MIVTAPRPTPVRTAPAARCPRDGGALSGGPILFWCDRHGHAVQAADLSRDVSR
jgi:hypothetical protein